MLWGGNPTYNGYNILWPFDLEVDSEMKRLKIEPHSQQHRSRNWGLTIWIVAAASLVGVSAVVIRNQSVQVPPEKLRTSPPPTGQKTTLAPMAGDINNPPSPIADTPTSPSPIPTITPTPSPTSIPVRRMIIGTSVAGRPLEVYTFGSGEVERMIIAGIHGGYEYNTVELAEELIQYLGHHPHFIPPNTTLYILPAFNPDGYARSRGYQGRANENGVDLNRNFPNLWQETWPPGGCWSYLPITGGSGPASEPETQALISFINKHQIDALISYHSAALGIFPGGQPPTSSSLDLADALSSVSDYPYPPLDTGCLYTGQLIDWASQRGIAAVDIELSNHQDTDFKENLAILFTFLNWQQDNPRNSNFDQLPLPTP